MLVLTHDQRVDRQRRQQRIFYLQVVAHALLEIARAEHQKGKHHDGVVVHLAAAGERARQTDGECNGDGQRNRRVHVQPLTFELQRVDEKRHRGVSHDGDAEEQRRKFEEPADPILNALKRAGVQCNLHHHDLHHGKACHAEAFQHDAIGGGIHPAVAFQTRREADVLDSFQQLACGKTLVMSDKHLPAHRIELQLGDRAELLERRADLVCAGGTVHVGNVDGGHRHRGGSSGARQLVFDMGASSTRMLLSVEVRAK